MKLNSGKTKEEVREQLTKMTDKELSDYCEKYIWLSAYAFNNPRSDYHFFCDASYDECKRREKPKIYTKAHKRASL